MELTVNDRVMKAFAGERTYPPMTVAALSSESVEEPATSDRPIV